MPRAPLEEIAAYGTQEAAAYIHQKNDYCNVKKINRGKGKQKVELVKKQVDISFLRYTDAEFYTLIFPAIQMPTFHGITDIEL